MRRENSNKVRLTLASLVVCITVFVVIAGLGFVVAGIFNTETYIVTVTDKERINDGDSSKYLVYADSEDGESLVFENTDSLFHGKFNSSNVQGKLKEGKTYELTVAGFRIPFLSSYQNIVNVEEIIE